MAITYTNYTEWNPSTCETITHHNVVRYAGRVISVFQEDYRVMSDVYTYATFATVVDENDQVKKVLVNANFELDTSGARAEVDATPEAREIYEAHLEEVARQKELREAAARADREEKERNRPVRGKKMVVTRGRKVPVGTVGVVAHVSYNGRVLLKPEDKWQDRRTDGVWVDPVYLKAV
jgi:hypothetical protein